MIARSRYSLFELVGLWLFVVLVGLACLAAWAGTILLIAWLLP